MVNTDGIKITGFNRRGRFFLGATGDRLGRELLWLSFNRRGRFFLGATYDVFNMELVGIGFNRRGRFFLGATREASLEVRKNQQFQSQRAILFGGYFIVAGKCAPTGISFNRRGRFFLGATTDVDGHKNIATLVSIAEGDSFWGLLNCLHLA